MVETSERVRGGPGADVPVAKGDDLSVLTVLRGYKKEADDAKRGRMKRSRVNKEAFLGRQDWSHKTAAQSKEFLPKTASALEQFTGFVKRALTQFGDWYDPELGINNQSPISVHQIRALMDCYLNDLLSEGNQSALFTTVLTDAIKTGALESLVILKIHGERVPRRDFVVSEGDEEPIRTEGTEWKLRIDPIRGEDYFPDPTGRGLYEIVSSEHDLQYVLDRAEDGVYDKKAVAQLIKDQSAAQREQERLDPRPEQETTSASHRKRVVIDEFWGDIVGTDGKTVHRNVFAAIANDKYLIRKPTPNPFWHQESPFLAIPLIRVPFSVWHKALYDDAARLNLALNELFNLFLDGGLASVWGVNQIRIDDLEDPREVSAGIPQGATLSVKNSLPHGAKVLEKVTEGEVPNDAMAIFGLVEREFVQAALSNELKLGGLPPKQVKATEVVELSQSQAITLDSLVADIEGNLIAKGLRKVWLTIMQNMGDASSGRIISAIGMNGAFALAQLTPAQRYALFTPGCAFKVHGLSAVMSKTKDFQKSMALLQSISVNPLLLQAFFSKYSPTKFLAHLMKMLSINPLYFERDAEEIGRLPDDIAQLGVFQELAGQGQGGQGNGQGTQSGLSAQDAGEPGLPAEINQASNPLTGLTSGGTA